MTTSEDAEENEKREDPLLRIHVLGPLEIAWPSTDLAFPQERLQGHDDTRHGAACRRVVCVSGPLS